MTTRVQALLEAALTTLRTVEWEGGDGVVFKCPVCRRWRLQGHELDCALARALADADTLREFSHDCSCDTEAEIQQDSDVS